MSAFTPGEEPQGWAGSWRLPYGRYADMDRAGLAPARDFGRQIVLQGSIDSQRALPSGGAEGVAAEVRGSQ